MFVDFHMCNYEYFNARVAAKCNLFPYSTNKYSLNVLPFKRRV
jgi:hypothetical protein